MPDHLEKHVLGKHLPLNPAVRPHTLNSRRQMETFFISLPFSLVFLQTVSVLSMRLAWSLEILCSPNEWFLTLQGNVVSTQFSCWPGQEFCTRDTRSTPIFWFCLEYKCSLYLCNTCTPNTVVKGCLINNKQAQCRQCTQVHNEA